MIHKIVNELIVYTCTN